MSPAVPPKVKLRDEPEIPRNIANPGRTNFTPMAMAWQPSWSAPITGYGLAPLLVAIALGARMLIGPPELGLQFITFFPAVALAAVYGGFGPGMLATAIAAILASFLYMPPYGSFSLDFQRATVMSNLAFVLDEVLVCGAIQAMHTYYRKFHIVNERLIENSNLLHAIIEGTTDAIFLKDTAGRYLHTNGTHARITGKTQDDLIGRDSRVVFTPEQARVLAANDAKVMATGKVETFEEVLKSAHGEVRNYQTIKGPVFDVDGNIAGIFGIARDVTEQRKEADKLKAAKAEAERANNAKSRFLAAASHDLRQPLTALSIYTGLLGDKLLPGNAPLLANIKNCVGSLTVLLSDLLDLSKLEAGVVKANISYFALDDTLEHLISTHAPEAQLKGLQLRYRNCNCVGHTDAVLFARIVGNLLANAIRYTDRGGVLVGCRRHSGRMWIEVWDTGIGIPADKTGEIFEEFKQLGDNARNRGSGLGLAIVAKAAALLQLPIRVASRPRRGSMFAVGLPIGHGHRKLAQIKSPGQRRHGRVALAEDNNLVMNALVYSLQKEGHEVVAAASGAELLNALGSAAPDVVVADYRLADGETGFDVITAARTRFGEDLPAIIITGDTDPMLLRSMADRGILIHHKPLDLEALYACLDELMRQRPADREAPSA